MVNAWVTWLKCVLACYGKCLSECSCMVCELYFLLCSQGIQNLATSSIFGVGLVVNGMQ